MRKKPWHPLENRILRVLREHGVRGAKVVVAVSGGPDSVILLHLLNRIRRVEHFDLGVLHIHHGGSGPQRIWRDKAKEFVERTALNYGLTFHSNSMIPDETLVGEAALREFRYKEISSILKDHSYRLVAVAHHRDDLLETRMIRLIRGVGPMGLLGMEVLRRDKLRPFLGETRLQLLNYGKESSLEWLEDPSNLDTDPLRNWIRRDWLPRLEKKRPGAVNAFGRSLDNVATRSQLANSPVGELVSGKGVSRAGLAGMARSEQRQALVIHLRLVGVNEFSVSQLDEVLKRLDSPKRELTFRVLGCEWRINAEYIRAHK